jgi:1,4-alpha-glucan branching enzyme
MFERLERDRVRFRLTMSLTPPLINMLNDTLLRNRFQLHLEKLIELTEKELVRTEKEPEFHDTAIIYNDLLKRFHKIYLEDYKKDIVGAFKNFQDRGNIEIMTCGATHGFFPLI